MTTKPRSAFRMAAMCAAVLLSATAHAQPPAPLIRVHKAPAQERAGSRPAETNPEVLNVVLQSITGHRDTWQLEFHGSFAALEQADAAFPPSFPNDMTRTSIAFYRQWWSHRPEEAMQALRRGRYMQVAVFRVPLQSEGELTELLKSKRASLDSINLDRPDLVYQILSGDQSGTFLILSPIPSLAVLDEGASRSAAAYLRSTGNPSQRSGSPALKSEITHENLLFRVDPVLSKVSAEFAELDPEFWKARR